MSFERFKIHVNILNIRQMLLKLQSRKDEYALQKQNKDSKKNQERENDEGCYYMSIYFDVKSKAIKNFD